MMPSFKISRYWLCQLVGWGLVPAINIFIGLFLFNQFSERVLLRWLFFIEMGILFSHLMRGMVHSLDLLLRNFSQQIIIFSVLIIFFSILAATSATPFEYLYSLRRKSDASSYQQLLLINFGTYLPLFIIWSLFYFTYHFVSKSRRQQMDTIKLEALVKELELKTIKAHINPHFIFNALNGIRALIDENPARARRAITELSNILRSSLSAEKAETVNFSDELKIVKDYLALENMRFEDRLKVEYDVDENTLDRQVPPMMLQTLVENAIKHGISKQVKGGVVKIVSDFRGNYHELAVLNTGHLNGHSKPGGFGLSSTKDRLHLLYGEKAKFEIKQLDPNLVEAKVLIPVSLN